MFKYSPPQCKSELNRSTAFSLLSKFCNNSSVNRHTLCTEILFTIQTSSNKNYVDFKKKKEKVQTDSSFFMFPLNCKKLNSLFSCRSVVESFRSLLLEAVDSKTLDFSQTNSSCYKSPNILFPPLTDFIRSSLNLNPSRRDTGYIGLENLGAICYMNSLLQQLYMHLPFRYSILSYEKNYNVSMDKNKDVTSSVDFTSLSTGSGKLTSLQISSFEKTYNQLRVLFALLQVYFFLNENNKHLILLMFY
jgi:hypothetical protein